MLRFLPLFLTLAIAGIIGATVYKWTDELGVTHYSDAPPNKQKTQRLETGKPPVRTELGTPIASPRMEKRPGLSSYTNPNYGWSISYLSTWEVDSSNVDFVRVHSQNDNALCGVHSFASEAGTVDELTDTLLPIRALLHREKGQEFAIITRRKMTLTGDIVANDVLVGIGPGGKSRALFVLVGGRGFVIDCETYVENWKKQEPFYNEIIKSFTLKK